MGSEQRFLKEHKESHLMFKTLSRYPKYECVCVLFIKR